MRLFVACETGPAVADAAAALIVDLQARVARLARQAADAASTSEMAHWQDTRDKREAAGAAQAHVSAHAGAATAATLDCVSESSPRIFPPAALLETAVASPPPFVIPQVEREVPVPPPKFATR